MSVALDHIALVRDVLRAAGMPSAVPVVRATEGVGNHVFLAGEVVVRLGTGSDAAKFPRSAAILRAARGVVRVPEVVYTEFDAGPVPVMVLQRMPGASLASRWKDLDEAARPRFLEAVALELEALHRLRPEDIPDAGFTSPWWQARADRIEGWLRSLRGTAPVPAQWFDTMQAYFEEHRDALENAPPACVLHNDVHWGNVLVDGETLTAILDFDDALAGPPEEDAWQLVEECDECDPPVPLRVLANLPGFNLEDPGVLPRLHLRDIENILESLTFELSWKTREEALADAREDYECFTTDHRQRVLARITARSG